MTASLSRAAIAAAALILASCGSLLGLDDYQRLECGDDCETGTDAGRGAGANSGNDGGRATRAGSANGGSDDSGGATVGSAGSGRGGSTYVGGSTGRAGDAGSSNGGSNGTGGMPSTGPCPGGPAPSETWQESWYEHTEALSLRFYDDCIAVYADPAMSATDTAWVESYVGEAWRYNLTSYGNLGPERLYVVLHLSKYVNGHVGAFYEATHDERNVIDLGANDWPAGNYDRMARLARLLSYVVERTAAPGKQGSPGSAQWSSDGFAQIYTYDLFVGLGLLELADQAYAKFNPTSFTYPVPNSYWFADYYYPTWRDHGQTKVLKDFFALLGAHYESSGGVMPPMNWGEYVHFASGAAKQDLQDQATYAFGWTNAWEQQLVQARTDYPAVAYEY